jgi:N-acetylglucosaminyldiphosphoundecaprenol N-acetyl-beta-D-mannosaminyltransferase
MRTERENFLDVAFDTYSEDALVARLQSVTAEGPYEFLVTPNVDHMVRLHDRSSAIAGLSDLYHRADYCLCDSRILALLAKWRGVDLPVIPGSDLTARIFTDVLHAGDRIAIIGGDESTPVQLAAKYPSIDIVQHIPPMGLIKNASARQTAAAFIAEQKPRFTFVCVGSPQQELIAAEAAEYPGARGLALCVGASLDFLTDRQKRAPAIVRQMKLEWAHRLVTNPRRLWRRYLVEGPAIFVLAYRWRKSAA